MNELEEIEKELAGLTSRGPSKDFSKQIENALGDAGSVAMKHVPVPKQSQNLREPASTNYIWIPLGLAALLVFSFYAYITFSSTISTTQPPSVVYDRDSPVHGVTTQQLEDLSGVPVDGWLDPSTQERFIRRIDEGIVGRSTGLPARQFRYHFVDETLWRHPATDTRILSTTPRQEVYLIDLEVY